MRGTPFALAISGILECCDRFVGDGNEILRLDARAGDEAALSAFIP